MFTTVNLSVLGLTPTAPLTRKGITKALRVLLTTPVGGETAPTRGQLLGELVRRCVVADGFHVEPNDMAAKVTEGVERLGLYLATFHVREIHLYGADYVNGTTDVPSGYAGTVRQRFADLRALCLAAKLQPTKKGVGAWLALNFTEGSRAGKKATKVVNAMRRLYRTRGRNMGQGHVKNILLPAAAMLSGHERETLAAWLRANYTAAKVEGIRAVLLATYPERASKIAEYDGVTLSGMADRYDGRTREKLRNAPKGEREGISAARRTIGALENSDVRLLSPNVLGPIINGITTKVVSTLVRNGEEKNKAAEAVSVAWLDFWEFSHQWELGTDTFKLIVKFSFYRAMKLSSRTGHAISVSFDADGKEKRTYAKYESLETELEDGETACKADALAPALSAEHASIEAADVLAYLRNTTVETARKEKGADNVTRNVRIPAMTPEVLSYFEQSLNDVSNAHKMPVLSADGRKAYASEHRFTVGKAELLATGATEGYAAADVLPRLPSAGQLFTGNLVQWAAVQMYAYNEWLTELDAMTLDTVEQTTLAQIFGDERVTAEPLQVGGMYIAMKRAKARIEASLLPTKGGKVLTKVERAAEVSRTAEVAAAATERAAAAVLAGAAAGTIAELETAATEARRTAERTARKYANELLPYTFTISVSEGVRKVGPLASAALVGYRGDFYTGVPCPGLDCPKSDGARY